MSMTECSGSSAQAPDLAAGQRSPSETDQSDAPASHATATYESLRTAKAHRPVS